MAAEAGSALTRQQAGRIREFTGWLQRAAMAAEMEDWLEQVGLQVGCLDCLDCLDYVRRWRTGWRRSICRWGACIYGWESARDECRQAPLMHRYSLQDR